MRSTPFTSCSTGVATDCSTASADAPGYVAVTRILGGARNGYCSTDSLRRTTIPNMTFRIEITMATIGRFIKKFDMASATFGFLARFAGRRRCRGRCCRDDLASRGHLLHALHDHALPCAEPLQHNVVLV